MFRYVPYLNSYPALSLLLLLFHFNNTGQLSVIKVLNEALL